MAKSLGCTEVEIRNDMKGVAIADGTPPEAVRAAADKAGVKIITINALYPFNVWSANMAGEDGGTCGLCGQVRRDGPRHVPAQRGQGRAA